MRFQNGSLVSSHEVYEWALDWLVQAKLLKDHGWLCTATVVWSIVLRAAANRCSVYAACRDLARAPSDTAIFNALIDGLPRTLSVLEQRLNNGLTGSLPQGFRRRAWRIAIDWHLEPYYGKPHKSRNELYYGKPDRGTTKFHAYASACIVQYGHRYTLALTWIRRHESAVTVLKRLLTRIREIGVKIKYLLLDRAFFNVPVTEFLKQEELPFLMPVVIRGRRPQKGRPKTGLHWIKRQRAGWYLHTLKNGKRQVPVPVCVAYRTHRNRKDGKCKKQKLLFAGWRVHGSPTEIRELYRKRFGIESSFRQRRQARIYTCTPNPHLRVVFFAVALILRNMWVWIHAALLADGRGDNFTLRLERLRFKRMLDWIAQTVVHVLHDGSIPCVQTNE
ncbi:MAG TPA: transposase [Pirellula sp.]|nr:transposase [Pirellula sp.]